MKHLFLKMCFLKISLSDSGGNDLSLSYLNRYRLDTSERVPEDYYGIIDILSSNTIHESMETIQEYRKNTFRNIITEMRKENTTDIQSWWYTHINAPNIEIPYGSDKIWFLKNSYLSKIIKLIEIFIDARPSGSGKKRKDMYYISFGVSKENFETYFKSNGSVVPVVKRQRRKDVGGHDHKYDHIIVDGTPSGKQVRVPMVPELQRWKDWCKLNGYQYGGAVLEAMKAQIESNPVEGLPPIEKYTTKTVTLVSNLKPNESKNLLLSLKADQYNDAKNIIEKYNKVNRVSIEKKMSMAEYVNKAVSMLNSVMAEEYLIKDGINRTEEQIKNIKEQEENLLKSV